MCKQTYTIWYMLVMITTCDHAWSMIYTVILIVISSDEMYEKLDLYEIIEDSKINL